MNQSPTAVGTISGRLFDVYHPNPSLVNMWDITWSLHYQCRYNGQIPLMWDVLSHTGLCVALAKRDLGNDLKLIDELGILIHDGSEAYLGDMVRPLKGNFPNFIKAEENVIRCILTRFGLKYEQIDWDLVKKYDEQALWTEQAHFGRDDAVYGNPKFDTSRIMKLTKAKCVDYIDRVRYIAINLHTADIKGLFEMPPVLEKYIGAYDASIDPVQVSTPAQDQAPPVSIPIDQIVSTPVDNLETAFAGINRPSGLENWRI